MQIILLGPPGSGKGTQAKLLTDRKQLRHISTGEILRDAVARQTPTGKLAKPYLDEGNLVPDELINSVVAEMFEGMSPADLSCGFMMDGYPRTVDQARAFDDVLGGQHLCLTGVVLLNVEDDEILGRITGRLTCSRAGCPGIFHVAKHPPQRENVCDVCGSPLKRRKDDKTVNIVKDRLQVYHNETEELIPYYRERDLLIEIKGMDSIEEVHRHIVEALEARAGSSC